MTTSVQDRPIAGTAGDGGTPARRAVIRWAWRLFRREWRRQGLVLALLILAIAATVIGLAVVTNAATLKADPTFGTANTILTVPGSDTALSSDLAALHARFGPVEAIAHRSVPIPGSVSSLDVRAEDPHGPYGHVMVRLDSGRYPAGADEVAMTSGAAKTFGVHVGDLWRVNDRSLRVVGLVENPLNLIDDFALVAPGQANSPTTVSILLDAGQHAFENFRLPSHTGMDLAGRGTTNQAAAAAVVLVLASVGLLFVGLMAVAGFAVLAHRRQRGLGMLAALGATDRHLRLVLLANGAAVGASAAVIGAGAGLLGWFAIAPAVQSVTNHRADRLDLPWWAVAAAMLLTLLTAILAAWWPARAVARLSPVAALSGRPPRPKPAHRFAAAGAVLLAAGLVLLAFADQRRVAFIISGTVATAIGLLLLAPLAIGLLAMLGRRTPIAVTLALRDLSRYQARSGAALGAITLAIGVAATIAISASAAVTPNQPRNLSDNQLVMYASRGGAGDPVASLSAEQLRTAQAAVDRVGAVLHATPLPLEQAYNQQASPMPLNPGAGHAVASPGQTGSGQPGGYLTAVLAKVTHLPNGEEISGMTRLYVATPEVLARYGVASSTVDPRADVLTSRTDLGRLQIFNPMPGPGGKSAQTPDHPTEIAHPDIQVLSQLPVFTSATSILLTTHAMQTLGLSTLPTSWFLQTSNPLTPAQIDIARKAAATAGLYVETRQPRKSQAPLRNWSTTAGIVLALGVLAMTVGLIRSETGGDLRTLTATGASSRTRRALTATTAGALALLGAVIGTGGAYAALLAWHRSNLRPLGQVPTLNLVIIVAGLPIVATIGGWLLAGKQPTAIARQPLE